MSTPPPAAGRSAAGWTLPKVPVNLMRNFTLENVTRAIEEGRDINEVDPEDGMTLLMEAVSRGKEDIVEYLVNQGADLNIFDHGGHTALLYYENAIFKEGNPEKIVQMLLRAGALLLPNNDGIMPLSVAIDDYEKRAEEFQRYLYNSNSDNSDYHPSYRHASGPGRIISNVERNYQAKINAEKAALGAWRAAAGLSPLPSDAIEWKEHPRILLRYRNIRDLIQRHTDRNVISIKLSSILSAQPVGEMQVDINTPVYILKPIIVFFFRFDFKFDLLVPSFGNRIMDDERAVSDYGIRNGGRLIISPRIRSGFLGMGGTRRSKRQRRNKTRVSKR